MKVVTGDVLVDITGRNVSEYLLFTSDRLRLHRYFSSWVGVGVGFGFAVGVRVGLGWGWGWGGGLRNRQLEAPALIRSEEPFRGLFPGSFHAAETLNFCSQTPKRNLVGCWFLEPCDH